MPKPEPNAREQSEQAEHPLVDELARVLEDVGPAGYARATARDFARGGKYNRPPRRRYALT